MGLKEFNAVRHSEEVPEEVEDLPTPVWDRGDVISPHHSCDSGRRRKSGSLRGRAQ